MARQYIYFLCILATWLDTELTEGRLTELSTERYPILAHKLQGANIDLNILSQRALLGPGSGFRFKSSEFIQTDKGVKRARLIQTYGDYEVFGPTAVAESNMEGHFTGHMYGDVARNLHLDIPNPEACKKNVKALINRAIRLEKLHPSDPNIDKKDGRRVIYANPKTRMARIVYVVEFFYAGDNFMSFPVYHMDACSNSVILSFNKVRNITTHQNINRFGNSENKKRLHDSGSSTVEHWDSKDGAFCDPSAAGVGGNKKAGRRDYNNYPLCLPVSKDGLTCKMEGTYSKVVDNENSKSRSKSTVISFPCIIGYSDAVNGAYGVAADAFYYGEKSGEFFEATFNMKALSHKPRLVVHYGRNYENAFWTGTDMFFGDGDTFFYPLVGLDVVAHELAHGITSSNSKLLYIGQSGGIDEAFCDITAVVTRLYTEGTLSWAIGETIMKSSSRAMRYLDNPSKDGRSIKNAWFYRPLMNVHFSSGVFNHAFYQMVEKQKMDILKAYQCYLIANLELWGPFTWFRRGACNVVQACYDAGYDYNAAKEAFKKTWIFLLLCRINALKTTIFPGETIKNILVSSGRSPIFEIDMTKWSGTGVRAIAEDLSVINVITAIDIHAVDIIAKEHNYVRFSGNHSKVYVKLTSHLRSDVRVTLDVLN